MTDEFFDDEQELMAEASSQPAVSAPAREQEAPARTGKQAPTGDGGVRRDPPPFWMVLAIAAIALVFGIVIGYLLGSSATLSALEAQSAQAAQTEQDSSAYALPEGHPSVEVDEDGTAHVAEDAE